MLPLFSTIAAGIFLLSVNVATAQDSGGLYDAQGCLLNCSLNAVTASGCDVQDTPCVCGSAIYASNVTQCAAQSCSLSASDVQNELNTNCGKDTRVFYSGGQLAHDDAGSASGSASAGPSASNSVSKPAPSGSASASNSAAASDSQQSGQTVPNSAVRTGVSALGLVFVAFLV
ncbi:hypothetical protein DFH06DRAFT_1315649 [Mycena polygramma]|nr:hypothetical protein DFH06DRAFT_1315649 [Mycena polygramma]